MTVFITHAREDRDIAEALAKVFERRGVFVEDEDGEGGFRPLLAQDVVVLLWSQKAMGSPWRFLIERRALDAWAEGRLLLVRLDHSILPVGLRDLAAMDATFEERRAFTWNEVAAAAQARAQPQAPTAPAPDIAPPQAKAAPKSAPARSGGGFVWTGIVLALIAAAAGASWAVFGEAPSFEAVDGGLPVWPILAGLGVLALSVIAIGLGLRSQGRASARKRTIAAPPAPSEDAAAAPPPGSPPVFVSYASVDGARVAPVVRAVQEEGRSVWIDKQAIGAGEGWAGEIVRAIKGADQVLVMCTVAAFESDHVKREVYLADRYKKRMLPVFLEAAAPPDDFEYFFSGVQWLKLFEAPEGQHARLVADALDAA